MSALSIHPVEYLKLHLHLDKGVGKTGLFAAIFSKVCELAEYVTATGLVALVISLFIFAFIQIGSATTFAWYYYTAISTIIFTP